MLSSSPIPEGVVYKLTVGARLLLREAVAARRVAIKELSEACGTVPSGNESDEQYKARMGYCVEVVRATYGAETYWEPEKAGKE